LREIEEMQNFQNEDMKDLVRELSAEVDSEQESSLSEEHKNLTDIARRLLMLERDMTLIGAEASQAARVDRLRDFIEKEEF
jgi:hypothetical protein